MRRQTRRLSTDLAVIGTGIAGFAASLFARDRGLQVAQVGHSGAIAYTTGYLDLLGVADGRVLDDPWAGLDALRDRAPRHPMARLSNADIRTACQQIIDALGTMGLAYTPPGARNLMALLPYGLTKPTLSMPVTMQPGLQALADRADTLVLDFDGLQGFSAREFQINLQPRWPNLRAARLAFPGLDARPVFPEVMARSLETAEAQDRLAEAIRPLLNGAACLGLPAILGIHAPGSVHQAMQDRLGCRVFEIPTIPPAVPGIRLRELFERELPQLGVHLEPNLKVARADLASDRIRLTLHGAMDDLEIEARAAILATGRFLSGGLQTDRHRVSESLLNLPVHQPAGREDWHAAQALSSDGHAVNRAGVEVDDGFRPLGQDGAPAHSRLFAAGAVLAHQDWVRQRCGAGLAIATAYGAVRSAAEAL